MEDGITLAEGNSNSLTLSGSGSLKLIKMTPEGTHVKPLIGTDGVAIAAPELGWYATAVAGVSAMDQTPGASPAACSGGTGGGYTFQDDDLYFELSYGPGKMNWKISTC